VFYTQNVSNKAHKFTDTPTHTLSHLSFGPVNTVHLHVPSEYRTVKCYVARNCLVVQYKQLNIHLKGKTTERFLPDFERLTIASRLNDISCVGQVQEIRYVVVHVFNGNVEDTGVGVCAVGYAENDTIFASYKLHFL